MKKIHAGYHSLIGRDGFLSSSLLRVLERREGSVLLETTRRDRANFRSFIFTQSDEIVSATSLDEVEPRLRDVDKALQAGLYAAGFISYEAGYAFEKALRFPPACRVPLLWFGLYRQPIVFNHRNKRIELGVEVAARLSRQLQSSEMSSDCSRPQGIRCTITEEGYRRALERIRDFIVEGDTYQVNFTFKLRFGYEGSPGAMYGLLRFGQRVGYAAFLNTGSSAILSFSPELFFRLTEDGITLQPMKGTAPRGRTTEEDAEQKMWLLHSDKNRAENRMIVDLIRNDVGRIARIGTVNVPSFFAIEQYGTVHQATSTITAKVRPGAGLADLVRCLFPSGSVTGAPKIRTMQIIRQLENEPRGIYTGSIGYFSPRRRAVFSVAIRTAVLDRESGTGEIGIGSGVTHDSDIETEYAECLLKARFFTEPVEEFQLIETMRWDRKSGWFLLPLHLRRLQRSAKYFNFQFNRSRILKRLDDSLRDLKRREALDSSFIVRLTMNKDGEVQLESNQLAHISEPVLISISPHRTQSADCFLFHKTTRRSFYDGELRQAITKGLFDVIFLNERDEVTEGARSNILIKKENKFFTPSLASGLLPGTFREYLLTSKQYELAETVVRIGDLLTADELYLCNAVRGLVKAKLIDGEGSPVPAVERDKSFLEMGK